MDHVIDGSDIFINGKMVDDFNILEKNYIYNPLVETNIANWGDLTGTTTDKRTNFIRKLKK